MPDMHACCPFMRWSGILCLFLTCCTSHDSPKVALVEIRVAGRPVRVELANTPELTEQGLMFRDRLAPEQGMLFVFPREKIAHFWMKNTRIPLSIAFIDASGVIVRIAQMTPYSLEPHSSERPVLYALEMNQGWFQRHNVGQGGKVAIPRHVQASGR